jgi:histidinol-phosphate aminotransferase
LDSSLDDLDRFRYDCSSRRPKKNREAEAGLNTNTGTQQVDSEVIEAMFRPEVTAMSPYIPGEQPQTGKVIKLNTNENPYPPSPKVIEAITAAAGRLERYPDPLGTAFRRAAGDVLQVDPEMILCGNGSDDCLTVLTRAFVNEGGRIRFPSPSYILYRTLAELQSARFEEVPFSPDFGLTPLFGKPDPQLRLVYLPNPNSPTGTIVEHGEILELADRLTCPLVIDEAYVDFAPDHAISLVKENPKIIVTRTLSKSYALAGLRFGYLVAHPDVVAMLRKVKDSYNTDMLSIAGATAAISDQNWLQTNVAKVKATRERMTGALRSLGFEVIPSHANFVWCTHPQRAAKPLYESLKNQGVLVRYMNYPNWGDGLRISVGTDEQIDALMLLIAQAI